jgi:hypothetical protein
MENERRRASIKKIRPIETNQIFKWRFNSEAPFVEATQAYVYLWESISGKFFWVWEGWTGSHENGDIFFYDFTIPYVNDDPIDRSYEMGKDELTFDHAYSKPQGQLGSARAHSAIVHIKLDPKTGISEGKFNAEFLGIHQSPQGKFYVKRENP